MVGTVFGAAVLVVRGRHLIASGGQSEADRHRGSLDPILKVELPQDVGHVDAGGFSLMKRAREISRFVRPSPTSCSTSTSEP